MPQQNLGSFNLAGADGRWGENMLEV